MKRIFITLFLVLSLVICLPSCDETKENADFVKFNEMIGNIPDNYKITVSTTSTSGHILNNQYSITTIDGVSKIEYRIETFNDFSIDGNNIVSNGYKTVTEGVCDNAQQTPGLGSYYNPCFAFSNKNIGSYNVTSDMFTGQITSLSGFMGLDKGLDEGYAENAKFTVSYSENYINSVEIIYVTAHGNTVVITYTFN